MANAICLARAALMETELIGRSAEVQTIAALLDAPAATSAALMIEGEPGIGKSTLWFGAVKYARRQGIRVLNARTSAAESVLACATLADLLADVDPQVWADLPDPQRRGLEAALLTQQESAAPPTDQRAVAAAFLTPIRGCKLPDWKRCSGCASVRCPLAPCTRCCSPNSGIRFRGSACSTFTESRAETPSTPKNWPARSTCTVPTAQS